MADVKRVKVKSKQVNKSKPLVDIRRLIIRKRKAEYSAPAVPSFELFSLYQAPPSLAGHGFGQAHYIDLIRLSLSARFFYADGSPLRSAPLPA